MKPERLSVLKRPWLGVLLPVLLTFGPVTRLSAQRAVTLQVGLTNGANVQLTWESRSVVSMPGLQIFPDYQMHKSGDLTNWTPLGDRFTGSIGGNRKTISSVPQEAEGERAFYRVESIVELSNAELIGEMSHRQRHDEIHYTSNSNTS